MKVPWMYLGWLPNADRTDQQQLDLLLSRIAAVLDPPAAAARLGSGGMR